MNSDDPALPRLDSPLIQKLRWSIMSDRYRAYATVLEAEAYAQQLVDEARVIAQPTERRAAMNRVMDKLISARVAGYLFIEFEAQSDLFGITPGETPIKWFVSDPRDFEHNQHDVVINNGTNIRENFIRAFRTSNVQYPPPSSHPSRSSFDILADMIKDSMELTGNSYKSSRNKALARDGYRCIITGIYDQTSLRRCPELGDMGKVKNTAIEIAHIFNESTVQGTDPTITKESENPRVHDKTYHAAIAMAILRSFGFSRFADAFEKSGGVHQVWNLVSLHHDPHLYFDYLDMWFEPTDMPHRYKIHFFYESHEQQIRDTFIGCDRKVKGAPAFVEFSSQYKDALPPDPLLLALHGLCARVAHMSGAAEFFDHLKWDAEETGTLALDGSSGPLLDQLLSPFAATIPTIT